MADSDYRFELTPSQRRRGLTLVRVEVAKLEKGLARTPSYHVGKGGVGESAIKGRYPQAQRFLAQAKADGTAIHAIEGGVNSTGLPYLDDGRHRFAALRDRGVKEIEVAVPRSLADRFGRLFGPARAPKTAPGSTAGNGPFNQPLRGLVEPSARSWGSASAVDRRALYEKAGTLAVAEKRAELARAIGANGRRMKPRKRPRPDGANGPVMTPHDAMSRTSRLLDARATDAGVTLFWHGGVRKGQTKAWGVILGYHAAGQVKGAPVRDARLSKRGIRKVREAVAKWWTARLREQSRRAKAREKAAREAPKTAPSPPKKPGVLSRAQKALVSKYSYLKDYFRPKGEGI